MTGINVDGFTKIINQNLTYQDEVKKDVMLATNYNSGVSSSIVGDFFSFVKEDLVHQEKALNDILTVVTSYSDSLTSVKHGYMKQIAEMSNAILRKH